MDKLYHLPRLPLEPTHSPDIACRLQSAQKMWAVRSRSHRSGAAKVPLGAAIVDTYRALDTVSEIVVKDHWLSNCPTTPCEIC
jgi:hypothetical protein